MRFILQFYLLVLKLPPSNVLDKATLSGGASKTLLPQAEGGSIQVQTVSNSIQNPWAEIKHLRFVTVLLNNFKMVK